MLLLAALRLPAVMLGVGSGALAATIVSLVGAVAFEITGVEGGARAALVPGMLAGFVVGGYVAGRLALHSFRFHGAVTGLVLTALVVFIAQGGGSGASVLQILALALMGMIVGGTAGILGGRNRRIA